MTLLLGMELGPGSKACCAPCWLLLAAWDIFVDSHSLSPPSNAERPEVFLGRAYVARAKSLHKVLEALRDAWVEDTVNMPEEQIYPGADVAGSVRVDLVPLGMPATQLGLPFPATQPDHFMLPTPCPMTRLWRRLRLPAACLMGTGLMERLCTLPSADRSLCSQIERFARQQCLWASRS